MTDKELQELVNLIDMPKRELRLHVGSDHGVNDRLNETCGWTRGDLIRGAIERGITMIYLKDEEGSLI